ncbi:MAG TPA: hypothetical protein VKS81_02805 [Bacteroidota bacterium]|nr:hypothetical protein [Bacteroidota bacterium]
MSVIYDVIGSTIFAGMLIVMLLRLNSTLVTGNYTSLEDYEMQKQTTQLSRIIEWDIYKMGYNVPTFVNKLLIADSSHLKFEADLNNTGIINIIEYQTGASNSVSHNPNDKQLTRTVDGAQLFISYNVTSFYLQYYDSLLNQLSTPVSAANLYKVRQIRVSLSIQTPDPISTVVYGTVTDTVYGGADFAKLIYLPNMHYIQ